MAARIDARRYLTFVFSAIGLLLCLALTASAAKASVTTASQLQSAPNKSPNLACGEPGEIVYPANGALGVNILYEVAAVSADDVWAVGSASGFYSYQESRGYIVHWDGTQWSITLSIDGSLYGIVAIAANDVWVVGNSGQLPGTITALALHWDGATWSEVSAPAPGMNSVLRGVSAVSSNDVWAAGSFADTGGSYPYVMHWDGIQWTGTSTGSEPGLFTEVEAIASNDVWAVGSSGSGPLAMHWDGTQWTRVAVPGSTNSGLSAVSAASSDDVWAVGGGDTLVVHWDGTSWTPVSVPTSSPAYFADVVAISANNVWVAGARYPSSIGDAIVMHWNGSEWTESAPARVGSEMNRLEGLAVAPGDDVWVVGSYRVNEQDQALASRRSNAQWENNLSPNVPIGYNTLRGIDALDEGDIWAVGSYGYAVGAYPFFWPRTLVLRWDGQSWSHVPSPNISDEDFGGQNYLEAVAAVASNDVWAVGRYSASYSGALILHWNGFQWAEQRSTPGGLLRGITAIASDDVWTVGSMGSGPTLIQHWNGANWSQVASPSPGTTNFLLSVDAVSANDVWAVGRYRPAGADAYRTLTMHWDGTAWSVIPSPNVGSDDNDLRAVTAISANDVWAVGYYGPAGSGRTLTMHWNGSEWTIVPSPNRGDSSFLVSVDAASSDNVWAAGNYFSGGIARTFVEHWDGYRWNLVASPNANGSDNYLFGIKAIGPDEIWAAGDYGVDGYSPAGTRQTLAQRITPSYDPIFSDVPTDNTFYPFIRCMACQGIIGGYSDGTFRPNNDVTRGQLSKIVSNSAGFNDDPGPQLFEDVPPGSTFYDWIQRLANRGYVSGYPCGGEGEPCGPDNLPYFRPNANATRGQISKIVSNAAGYSDTPPGQTFEDVPPANPFYLWIERLATRGIMSGYPCGSAGEPCGPEQRPYFRWGSNATRGQTSKIVANTFFPNCQVAISP